jgi:hypothetical protein
MRFRMTHLRLHETPKLGPPNWQQLNDPQQETSPRVKVWLMIPAFDPDQTIKLSFVAQPDYILGSP